MKNIFRTALASIVLMTGCATDEELNINKPAPDKFYASTETPSTRTYSENDMVFWTKNDQITLFKGDTNRRQYQFTGETGQTTGEFVDVAPSAETGAALPANYAIYPYDANAQIHPRTLYINYSIPTTQYYAEDSFGPGANIMVAKTDNKDDDFLEFKNLCGYFEFSLYGKDITVKNIEFKGNNNEHLAGGVASIHINDGLPTISSFTNAVTAINLDCGEGVKLGADAEHATKFWIVVPANSYTKGITLTITDINNKTAIKSTSKSFTIERSTVQPLAAFEVHTNIPNNQIWYTSSDGNIITPNNYSFSEAKIESNVYENGKGVITFDRDLTYIGSQAFFGKQLISVVLPNSLKTIENQAFSYTSLTQVVIPDGVEVISGGAFSYNPILNVTIPNSVKTIGNEVFDYNARLKEVVIPYGVETIGGHAFNYCQNLTKINIPNSVTTIGDSAFQHCEQLNSIDIPNSVISIGGSAFSNSGLISIVLPNSITEIHNSTFSNCYNLESVTFPESIKKFNSAYSIFSNTDGHALMRVYCKPTTPPEGCPFNPYVKTGRTIYVPMNSVELYKAADGWKDVADWIVGYNF